MRTRRRAYDPVATVSLSPAEAETETDDDYDDEPFQTPPRRKRIKNSPPRRSTSSKKKRGPLETLLNATLEENKEIAAALQNDTPLERTSLLHYALTGAVLDDERVDVVVKEARREGPCTVMKCRALSTEFSSDLHILVNNQSLSKNTNLLVGRQLTVCSPWHEIQLAPSMTAWICPFVLPRHT